MNTTDVKVNMNNKDLSEKEKTVIFLHIPKTGGLTLTKIAKKNYDSSSIYEVRNAKVDIDKFRQLSIEEKRKIKLLAGHVRFGIHEDIPQQSTYITMLREPVERVISAYFYMRSTPNHPFHKKISQKDTFEDFLETRWPGFNNGQVRMLSGVGGKVKYGKCDREMLETAKYNLNNFFSVIGITERFDEFLILCQRSLGYKFPLYTKVNVTKKRPLKEQISKKALRIIEEDNALDLELYNYVKEQFEQSFKGSNLQFSTNLFKLANNIYGQTSVFHPKIMRFIHKMKKLTNLHLT